MSESPESTPSHSIADYLQSYENEGRLRGYRCANCGFVTATWSIACPRCSEARLVEIDLSGRGRIVAFTVQNVPGDEFLNEAPYAYVVVGLEEGGRITGWMPTVRRVEDLAIGDAVHFQGSYKPGVQFVKDGAAAREG